MELSLAEGSRLSYARRCQGVRWIMHDFKRERAYYYANPNKWLPILAFGGLVQRGN